MSATVPPQPSQTILDRVATVDDAIAIALSRLDAEGQIEWLRAELMTHIERFGWEVEALTADVRQETDREALIEMLSLMMKAEAADLTGSAQIRVRDDLFVGGESAKK